LYYAPSGQRILALDDCAAAGYQLNDQYRKRNDQEQMYQVTANATYEAQQPQNQKH